MRRRENDGSARRQPALWLALALALTAAAGGQEPPVVGVKVAPEGIAWTPRVESAGAVLTVSGPHFELRRVFEAGEKLVLEPRGVDGMEDGGYVWELVLTPAIDEKVRRELLERRAAGEAPSEWELKRKGVLPAQPLTAAGAFTLRDGRIVPAEEQEKQRRLEPRPKPRQEIDGELFVKGDLSVEGAKRFTVPDADGGAIDFAALEGPEVGTYFRGTATTAGGEAVIELPEHFVQVTEAEGLTVQLTPLAAWSRLYVAEKTRERLVVRDAAGGDAAFDYLIQGVRRGYGDFQPRRDAGSNEQGGER